MLTSGLRDVSSKIFMALWTSSSSSGFGHHSFVFWVSFHSSTWFSKNLSFPKLWHWPLDVIWYNIGSFFFFSWIPTWVSDPYIFCVVSSYLKEKADMVSVTVFYQKGLFFNIWLGSEVRVMLINLCFIVPTQLKKCEKLILITACV